MSRDDDHEPRTAAIERETKESKVLVELDLDGTGRPTSPPASASTTTCSTAFGRHSLIDLTVQTEGDTHIDAHHTVEDTAIVLGEALREALGDKAGIRRFGDATVPLDEALVQAAVDVSGRPYCVHTGEPDGQAYVSIGGDGGRYLGSLTRHVFETLASHAQIALHVRVLSGRDPHHLVEAQFKAVRPGAARRGRARPAGDRRALHQGHAVTRPQCEPGRRPRLRVGQPPLRRARPGARRRRGHADRRPAAALDADGLVVPGRRRLRGLHGGPARGARSRDHRPPAGRRPSGARHLRRHADPLRARRRARRRHRRAAASGRAPSSGSRRRSSRTWAGTPSRSPRGTALFAGVEDERFYFVHSYAVRDWTLVTNGRTRAPLVPGPSTAATGSSRRSRTARCAPPSSTPRSPATRAPAAAQLGRTGLCR